MRFLDTSRYPWTIWCVVFLNPDSPANLCCSQTSQCCYILARDRAPKNPYPWNLQINGQVSNENHQIAFSSGPAAPWHTGRLLGCKPCRINLRPSMRRPWKAIWSLSRCWLGHSGAELSRGWLQSREAYHTAGFQFSVQIKLVSDSSHRKALGEVPHNGAIWLLLLYPGCLVVLILMAWENLKIPCVSRTWSKMPTWNCGRSHEFTPWHAATLPDKSPYTSQGVAAICSNSVRNERKELNLIKPSSSLENAVAMYCHVLPRFNLSDTAQSCCLEIWWTVSMFRKRLARCLPVYLLQLSWSVYGFKLWLQNWTILNSFPSGPPSALASLNLSGETIFSAHCTRRWVSQWEWATQQSSTQTWSLSRAMTLCVLW